MISRRTWSHRIHLARQKKQKLAHIRSQFKSYGERRAQHACDHEFQKQAQTARDMYSRVQRVRVPVFGRSVLQRRLPSADGMRRAFRHDSEHTAHLFFIYTVVKNNGTSVQYPEWAQRTQFVIPVQSESVAHFGPCVFGLHS